MGQPVMYWQILSKRPAKSCEFYGSIFGWNVWPPDALGQPGRRNRQRRKALRAGSGRFPSEAHSMVQLFIRVDDVDGLREASGGRRRQSAFSRRK